MRLTFIATRGRIWLATGLLMLCFSLSLSAYEQGSYYLFDLREDTAVAKAPSGRILISATVFKSKELKTTPKVAGKGEKKSEFETEITSFRKDDSDSVTTGITILDEGKDASKSQSTFGENAPATGGFFFNY
ncbi:MAG TPA: hypothetical protein VJ933_10975 [Phaeodactylibacter sp.]|nr:hypothetical protein [Phaeodactylibacter sp.]